MYVAMPAETFCIGSLGKAVVEPERAVAERGEELVEKAAGELGRRGGRR